MLNENNTFIIGDLHFGDEGIIKICDRPFEDTQEMEDTLISNWNTHRRRNDTIIVNGDLSFTNDKKVLERVIPQLVGHIILIRGNHDTFDKDFYINCGIESVYDFPIAVDDFFIISHEPLFVPEIGPYANIFSHVHTNPNYRDYSGKGFCTSCERKLMNYTPISLKEAKKYMRGWNKAC